MKKTGRERIRMSLEAPGGLSPTEAFRIVRAVYKLRKMIRRHGLDAVAEALEQSAANHPGTRVVVRRPGHDR